VKIITENVCPPIPDRSHDWQATAENYEPGAPMGSGPTERAAIEDLVEQLVEAERTEGNDSWAITSAVVSDNCTLRAALAALSASDGSKGVYDAAALRDARISAEAAVVTPAPPCPHANRLRALESFTPTPQNVNALPEPLRRYIHDLETRCDPQGDIARLIIQQEQLDGLGKMFRESEDARRRLEIRAGQIPFYGTPPPYNIRGSHSAYSCGFEAGFRGWERRNPYTSVRCYRAWSAGYAAGTNELRLAVKATKETQE
jgi:hypothetical protein